MRKKHIQLISVKRVLSCIILCIFLLPQGVEARWIGEWARSGDAARERKATRTRSDERRERTTRGISQSRSRTVPSADGRVPWKPRYQINRRMLPLLSRTLSRFKMNRRSDERKTVNIEARKSSRAEARRRRDLQNILSVLQPYMLGNDTSLISETNYEICKANARSCDGFLDLSTLLREDRLRAFPSDPTSLSDSDGTGYFVQKTAAGGLKLTAPNTKLVDGILIEWSP